MSFAATVQARYSFTAQYIVGAVLLARRAQAIETESELSPTARAEHRAYVVGAILQASAAIEAELAEVVQHGPGHFLGSDGLDVSAREFLRPIAPVVDRISGVLERWNATIHILRRERLEKNSQPYQDAQLLIGLRNELVHYRSNWDGAMTSSAVLRGLIAKQLAPPLFFGENVNAFPHKILGAACAEWAALTAAAYIDEASDRLCGRSPLDGHRQAGADFANMVPSRRKVAR